MASVLFDSINNPVEENSENNDIKKGNNESKISNSSNSSRKHKKKGSKSFTIENVKDFLETYNCPICINWIVTPATLSCGHSFCKDCLEEQKNITKSRHYECGVCRKKHTTDISINLIMEETMKIIGGQKYQKCLDERMFIIKEKKLIEKYHKTDRYIEAKTAILSLIEDDEDATFRTYPEIIEEFKFTYPETEIKYILSILFAKKNIVIYNDKIFSKHKIMGYISSNINDVPSRDILLLLHPFISATGNNTNSGINNDIRSLFQVIHTKYSKYTDNKLTTFIRKKSNSDMKLLIIMIENILYSEQVEDIHLDDRRCTVCGIIHDVDDEEDEEDSNEENNDEDSDEENNDESDETNNDDDDDQSSSEYSSST